MRFGKRYFFQTERVSRLGSPQLAAGVEKRAALAAYFLSGSSYDMRFGKRYFFQTERVSRLGSPQLAAGVEKRAA
ncbi:hypothetical protein ACVRYP_00005, partial [Streptococcus rifensis]